MSLQDALAKKKLSYTVLNRHDHADRPLIRCNWCGTQYGFSTSFNMVVEGNTMHDECPRCHDSREAQQHATYKRRLAKAQAEVKQSAEDLTDWGAF